MTTCKYKSKCEYYEEDSETCNNNQFKEDGIYCGEYRRRDED